jgi:hypothetical protein
MDLDVEGHPPPKARTPTKQPSHSPTHGPTRVPTHSPSSATPCLVRDACLPSGFTVLPVDLVTGESLVTVADPPTLPIPSSPPFPYLHHHPSHTFTNTTLPMLLPSTHWAIVRY